MTVLLVLGLLFPVISCLSTIISLIDRWKHKKHSSPLYIPFIGPVLLTIWIISSHSHLWLVLIAWICDIGTIAFMIASPRLILDWWNTCSFTRILNLHSSYGIQRAKLSFHSTGRYFLHKEWHHPPGEYGTISVGDGGHFVRKGDVIEMTSDWGWSRKIHLISDNCFKVIEEINVRDKNPDYSISNWTFEKRNS